MMKALPLNWKKVKLGDVLTLEYGKSFPAKDRSGEGFPVMGSNGEVGRHAEYLVEGPGIVVGRKGSHGEVRWVDENFFPIDTTYYVIPKPGIDLNFAYNYLKFSNLKSLNRSTTIPGLNRNDAYALSIPLPPLAEQKRIVAKLDEAFKHLETLKAKLERIPVLLKKFRQTVLTHAVTGKLTEEWRKGKELEEWKEEKSLSGMREVKLTLPTNWRWLPFDSVAMVNSKLVQPLKYLNYPLIAPDNIEAESGKLLSKPLVSDILPKSAKHFFAKGSIVYSKIRPYLSKVILADFEGLCSADMYPISTSLNTSYLYYFMLSDIFLHYATTAGERSVLPKINQKELGVIPVSTPPKIEQKEIVDKIESLFSLLGKIELQNEDLRKKLDEIPPALLAKAFRGELVDQDESDEPASKLLERVKENKEANIIRKKVAHQKTVTNNKMKGSEEESLIAFLKVEFEKGSFTFDELRSKSKLDYDELKDEIFKLLSEAKELATIFDEKDEVIKYKLVQDEDLKN